MPLKMSDLFMAHEASEDNVQKMNLENESN